MVVGCWCCAGDGDGVSVRLVDLRWLLGFWWMLLADFVGPAAVRSSVRLVVVDVVGPAAVCSSVRLVVVVDFLVMWMCISSSLMLW